MANVSILDGLKRKKILELLENGKRTDGRAFDEPRTLSIETGVIPKANGSARVRLGDTEVIAGVKVQPDRPFPDMGEKGIFICTAEILPLAHPTAEPGPPGEDVIELSDGIKVNWAKELGRKLLELQGEDGSWKNINPRWWEDDPVLVTSYVLTIYNIIISN